jgi:hypothetical protein
MSVPVRVEYDPNTDTLLVNVAARDGGEVTLRRMPTDPLSDEDKRRLAHLRNPRQTRRASGARRQPRSSG